MAVKYLPINNYFKCKRTKCPNQKIYNGWVDEKTGYIYILPTWNSFRSKDTKRLQSEGMEKILYAKGNEKKAGDLYSSDKKD